MQLRRQCRVCAAVNAEQQAQAALVEFRERLKDEDDNDTLGLRKWLTRASCTERPL